MAKLNRLILLIIDVEFILLFHLLASDKCDLAKAQNLEKKY